MSDNNPILDLSVQKDKSLDCTQILPLPNSPQMIEKDDNDVF